MSGNPALEALQQRVEELEKQARTRKRAEEALRQSEEKYRFLVEESPLAVALIGKDGCYKYINPKFVRMFGYTLEDIPTGRRWFEEAYPDPDYRKEVVSTWIADLKESRMGESRPRVYRVTCKDGSQRIIHFRPVTLDSGDQFIICEDITERKRAEEALRESEDRYRQIIENMTDVYYRSDLEGNLISVSPSGARLLGYGSTEEVLGKNIAKEFYAHPEEREHLTQEIMKHGTIRFEGTLRRKDGALLVTETNSRLVCDEGGRPVAIEGIFRDISGRKRAEEALRESREKLQGIITSVTDHMSMIDEEYTIMWANDIAKELFGPNLVGKKCYRVYHGYLKPCQPCIAEQCFEDGQVHEHERQFITAEGRPKAFWSTASVASRHEDGRPKTVVQISRDVTERKTTEERLSAYHRKLRSLASELTLAEERERRRIASEVHDHIGQNLAFARMKLGELRKSTTSPDSLATVDEIMELINGTIQDTRSLVSEVGSPVLYELGFAAAVEWLAKETQKHHGIVMGFEDDSHPKPLGNDLQVLLFKAVRELLANLAKHSQASRGTVSISRYGDQIRVDVTDDGIGFDAKQIGQTVDAKSGFGFFSIMERLEPLGGCFEVHSTPGHGTRATLRAPLSDKSW